MLKMVVRGEPCPEQSIHALFGGFVERSGGLVEVEPGGLEKKGARERQPLLLTRRKLQRPVLIVVETFGERREIHTQRVLRGSPRRKSGRIGGEGHRAAQTPDRNVGTLRQKERPAGRSPDTSPWRTARSRRWHERACSCRCRTAR